MKYADQRRSPFAVIQGSTEREASQLVIKDLVLGAKLAAEITDRDEWAAQPAQETISQGELVAYLRSKMNAN